MINGAKNYSWNVRGMDNRDKRVNIRHGIQGSNPNNICL